MKQSSIERTDLRLRELSRRMYQVSESYQAAVLCVSPRATTEMVGSDCSIVACASVWRLNSSSGGDESTARVLSLPLSLALSLSGHRGICILAF